MDSLRYHAVAIGVSTGGLRALDTILRALPRDYPLPLLIVQHIDRDAGGALACLLDARCGLKVKEADDQDEIVPGTAYLAPANYHLLVESRERLSLSVDPLVSFARPSIDVLFESAADVFGPRLIGVVLTGANFDGSEGLKRVKARGGLAIVQEPADAEAAQMPRAALAATEVDHVVPLAGIAQLLDELASPPGTAVGTG
jgi:two-component system, chemotaxis family, protein-glutamate methylesterase/glutaminase